LQTDDWDSHDWYGNIDILCDFVDKLCIDSFLEYLARQTTSSYTRTDAAIPLEEHLSKQAPLDAEERSKLLLKLQNHTLQILIPLSRHSFVPVYYLTRSVVFTNGPMSSVLG
jgi:hypothetical protein